MKSGHPTPPEGTNPHLHDIGNARKYEIKKGKGSEMLKGGILFRICFSKYEYSIFVRSKYAIARLHDLRCVKLMKMNGYRSYTYTGTGWYFCALPDPSNVRSIPVAHLQMLINHSFQLLRSNVPQAPQDKRCER